MLANGIFIISKFIKSCIKGFGVYKMLDKDGVVLYVGKAKNLKARLLNYTNPNNLSYKNQKLISHVASVEVIHTTNEQEALILELNLIKQYRPKYNVLLKDNKSFPYIAVDEGHDFPKIVKYRGIQKIKGAVFGPFASSKKASDVLALLQKAFLIRSCSDSFFKARVRPCILYEIKRCSAPCTAKIDKKSYAALIKQVKEFLSGKNFDIQASLAAQMETASLNEEYERAATYRDRIKALSYIQAHQAVEMHNVQNVDVVTALHYGQAVALQIFFIRNGKNLGNKIYEVPSQEPTEVLQAFIGKFYHNNLLPDEILINYELQEAELLEGALRELHNKPVRIVTPLKGKKLELLSFCINNLEKHIEQKQLLGKKYNFFIEELTKLFGIKVEVNRIEVYDNSHISGTNALGVMVVATRSGLQKSEYKKYNIKFEGAKETPDDYLMLRQVLQRRFSKAETLPELVIIDGGKGHLNIAKSVLEELCVSNVFLISIAKGVNRNSGEETIYDSSGNVYNIDKHSKTKQFLQVLRDEAHRFAITSHRKKRLIGVTKSLLDQAPGIGQKRKKLLLAHFGSVENLRNASVSEIGNVTSINNKIAQKLYEFFRKNL